MDSLLCFVDIRFSHDLELNLDSFPIGDVDFTSNLAIGLDVVLRFEGAIAGVGSTRDSALTCE